MEHQAVDQRRQSINMIRMDVSDDQGMYTSGVDPGFFQFLDHAPGAVDHHNILLIQKEKGRVISLYRRHRTAGSDKN